MSNTGLRLITSFEGFSANAYLCPAGVMTIGYGTTRVDGQPVRAGMTCTGAQAMAWKLADIAGCEASLSRLVPSHATLAAHQRDAVVSFIYNVGAVVGWALR